MPRSDDDIITLLQGASAFMTKAKFQEALGSFEDILNEKDNENVAKFIPSIQGMMGECLLSLARIPYASFSPTNSMGLAFIQGSN